jgi:hypothetical protein
MQSPVSNKIFFAGEALPVDLENWGFAHGAALSGKKAAQQIIALPGRALRERRTDVDDLLVSGDANERPDYARL